MNEIKPGQPHQSTEGAVRQEFSSHMVPERFEYLALSFPVENEHLVEVQKILSVYESEIANLYATNDPTDRRIAENVRVMIDGYVVRYKELLEGSSNEEVQSFLNTVEIHSVMLQNFLESCKDNKNDPDILEMFIQSFIQRNIDQSQNE